MDWLNYHHLFYFWVVAREGSIARACDLLQLAQPTISHQIHELEDSFGQKLFNRVGRTIQLTEQGQVAYRYASDIFTLGRELQQTIKGLQRQRTHQFRVGIAGLVPPLLLQRLLAPAWDFAEPIQVTCHSDKADALLAELAVHQLDLLLADAPPRPAVRVRAYPQLLDESGIVFVGTPELAALYRPNFPQSLNQAPLLLPPDSTGLRRGLERWFASEEIHPFVRGTIGECAMLDIFGQTGKGLFVLPSSVETEARERYSVEVVGQVDSIRTACYAISTDRKLKNPICNLIIRAAQTPVPAL